MLNKVGLKKGCFNSISSSRNRSRSSRNGSRRSIKRRWSGTVYLSVILSIDIALPTVLFIYITVSTLKYQVILLVILLLHKIRFL